MTRTRHMQRTTPLPPQSTGAVETPKTAAVVTTPELKSKPAAQADAYQPVESVGGVAPTTATKATPADVKQVFDTAKLAFESAKTVMGDDAWGDVNAQLQRITALDKGPRRDITIIGAGMAGLAAAYELERRGHHVRILEGNDRLGGRVFTHHFEDGAYHELGAMRIPASHDYTRHYVKELGLSLRKFVTSGQEAHALYDVDGVTSTVADAQKNLSSRFSLEPADAALKDPGAIVGRYLQELVDTLTPEEKASLFTTTLSSDRLKQLDKISLGDWLKAHANHDTVELIAMTTGLGGQFDRSMSWHLRDEVRGDGKGLEEIVGGMDQLPHKLAERLETPIEFGTKLLGIRNLDDGKVELTLSKNGGPPYTETDSNVLVTLPFSVMRGVQTPTFSSGKREAIRELSYSSATKVLLDTKERFWELNEHIHGGASHSDGINGATYYPSDNAFTASPEEQDKISHGPGALVGSYVWGEDARKLGAMTPEDREKAVVASVARIHPEITEPGMVKDFVSIAWDQNPWSAGAFAAPAPGENDLYREGIAPEGNVHFAGEHLSRDTGWIQGALISSLRAVEEIVTQPVAQEKKP